MASVRGKATVKETVNRGALAEDKPLTWLQLAAKARVERDSPASVPHESLPRKCLDSVHLQARGEVAERLKAAVC